MHSHKQNLKSSNTYPRLNKNLVKHCFLDKFCLEVGPNDGRQREINKELEGVPISDIRPWQMHGSSTGYHRFQQINQW